MEYFIDTNIFLRVIVKEEDKTYQDCYSLLKRIESGRIKGYSSHIVLAEIVWTLTTYYKLTKRKIVKSLDGISKLGIKFVDNFKTETAHKSFSKIAVKYVDALIASIPDIYNKKWTVVSYDKDFDKLKVLRKEPHQIK